LAKSQKGGKKILFLFSIFSTEHRRLFLFLRKLIPGLIFSYDAEPEMCGHFFLYITKLLIFRVLKSKKYLNRLKWLQGGYVEHLPKKWAFIFHFLTKKIIPGNKYWLQVLLGFSNFGSNSGIKNQFYMLTNQQKHIQGLVIIMKCINKAAYDLEINQGSS